MQKQYQSKLCALRIVPMIALLCFSRIEFIYTSNPSAHLKRLSISSDMSLIIEPLIISLNESGLFQFGLGKLLYIHN